jgi:hypothetical protein
MTPTAKPMARDAAASPGGRSFERRYDIVVADEFAAQPLVAVPLLSEADIADLPAPVRRFVLRSGAVGRPRPQNVRVVFDANMWRKPGQAPMRSTSVQYNFFGRPARLFLMKARMFGLPTRALHVYRSEAATFQVRVASLVNVVDQSGDDISSAETVTVLNDMCFLAPGSLADPRLTWQPVDDRSAVVTFTNGRRRVSATLVFNASGELVDFWSDDRPNSSGGTFIPMRWNTPMDDYRDAGGMHLAHHGKAVYAYPEGPFAYGEFTVRSIDHDVAGPTPL